MGVVHSVLSLSFVYFWGKFAECVLPFKFAALWATVLLAWTPTLLFSFSYPMSETLLMPLLGWALLYSVRVGKTPTIRGAIFVGLLWGLCAQVRIVAFPFIAVSLLAAFWPTRSFRKFLVAVAVVACCALPQAYRTHRNLGFIAPFGGTHLFNYYYFWSGAKEVQVNIEAHEKGRYQYAFGSPSFSHSPFLPFSNWTTFRQARYVLNVDLKNGKRDWVQNLDLAPSQKDLAPQWIIEGLVYFLFGHSWPEAHLDGWNGYLCFYSRWLWGPILIASLILSIGYLAFVRLALTATDGGLYLNDWFPNDEYYGGQVSQASRAVGYNMHGDVFRVLSAQSKYKSPPRVYCS